jgi:hypothetical protein
MLKAFRLLLELCFPLGEGKPLVHLSDEAGVADAVNGGHEISDLARVVDAIDLRCGFKGLLSLVFCHTDEMLAEDLGKKEILLQKKEIGVDVKETKGHCSATECFKGKGHEKSPPQMGV